MAVKQQFVPVATITVREVVSAQGQVPNFVVYNIFHLTFNANAELTSLKSESRTDCM